MLERTQAHMSVGATRSLAARRALFAALVAATCVAVLALFALVLSPGGIGLVDGVMIALLAIPLPWSAIGFWNATIGLILMRFARDPVGAVCPPAIRVHDDAPVLASTAILMCIRNEDPDVVLRNLDVMLTQLAATGEARRFHLYVLSDTNLPAIAAQEDARFGALTAQWLERVAITYRRRDSNEGFKAGNIKDFCERWGAQHDFAITLDADSVMPAAAMLRLVRMMQNEPRIGILQGLVIGMPSTSAFARLFQFGMRLGMRSYTLGSAWWQGDCGPYWGHNAILRLAPFIAHCQIPDTPARGPLGGPILSHDQIEAVLMRRAGYEVRAVPREDLGWEENPPTLLEFLRRDLRWCHGNMQYWRFLRMPGLLPTSRVQLVLAMLMFVGSPVSAVMVLLICARLLLSNEPFLRVDAAIGLFAVMLTMAFAPKIATVIDVLMRADLRKGYGGAPRFIASVAAETVFATLLAPVMWFAHSIYLGGLLLGRTIGWNAQTRSDHAVPFSLAVQTLWPHTLYGGLVLAMIAASAPGALPYALYFVAGLALAIPFAMLTASPALGRLLVRTGLGRLPEETDPPPALRALRLPAIEAASSSARLRDRIRSARGVIRSLRIYYGHRARREAMDRLYAQFIKPGDLAFDIGAHVGDRIGCFRRLGAKVVAVEPQPPLIRTLRLLYGRDAAVAIEPAAVGAVAGTTLLRLNVDNPTISTASEDFIAAANDGAGWQGQTWDRTIEVATTTLDDLIARHGMPAFIKIDVEGFELQALTGLNHSVAALSFEFTTIQRDVALACVDRCVALGYRSFGAALGESQVLIERRRSAEEIKSWLTGLPEDANSGDIYATLA